jgi:uncharacterized protein (TIGR03435 family)
VIRSGLGAAAVAAVAAGVMPPPFVHAQPAAPVTPHFDVASIKRSALCNSASSIYGAAVSPSPGTLTLDCATVAGLILGAYGRYANGQTSLSLPPPISGGPSWINSDRYTIKAGTSRPENRAMMNGPMLQTLLEERFQLKLHRERRLAPVFALTKTRKPARLKVFQEGSCTPVDFAQSPSPRVAGQPPFCQNRIQSKGANLRSVHVPAATVPAFAEILGVVLGRPVLDRTGIPGKFEFDLEFAIDQSTPGFVLDGTSSSQNEGPSIFTAIQEELGLRLQSTKGPVEFLVIDRVEMPSEN